MSNFDAIVIGGGINGLVAATVLARRGKSVCLFEQNDTLGGMAGLSDGPGTPALAHLVYNISPKVALEIGSDIDAWPFSAPALPTVALAESGRHVIVRDGRATFADGTPHPDADAFQALNERIARYGDILRAIAEAPPPGMPEHAGYGAALRAVRRLGRMGMGLRAMGKAETRRFMQVLLSNVYDFALDDLDEGPLAGLLAADAVRGAAAGPRSPGTVFNLIYRMGHGGHVRVPEGGVGAVLTHFATAARDAGCRMQTARAVARILTTDDCVTGVEIADGEIAHAPLVLASPGAGTTLSLTGTDHFDIETARRVRKIRARGTAAKINFELSRPFAPENALGPPGPARYVVAPSAAYVERAFNPSKYGAMSENPVIEAVPQSVSGGRDWLSCIVQYAPSDLAQGWTDAARARLLRHTTDTLTAVVPGFSEQVTGSQITTPDQIEARTGAPGGHWHQAEMSLDQVLSVRPANMIGHYAFGPKGLFLCGASTHPGGDIMGLSGCNAALCALGDPA